MNSPADYWPILLAVSGIALAAAAAIHAAMNKDDVRAAIGWVGIAIFSPFIGASIYFLAGVNRVRRSAMRARRGHRGGRRQKGWSRVDPTRIEAASGPQFRALKHLGDLVASMPFTDHNTVTMLDGGRETYPAMLEAIEGARRSIALQTYILDDDPVGRRFVDALKRAVARGVAVRVLIDAVGARYSRPPITGYLRRSGVPTGRFLGNLLPMRLPYANLRTHRKVLLVDGTIGFAGGMNIRAAFHQLESRDALAQDTHFRFEGPMISQLFRVFAGDWWFTTGERLKGRQWAHQRTPSSGGTLCRPIDSGPDDGIERAHSLILGALSVAQTRIRIQTPYFLPDGRLVSALAVAARRGVEVDILIPENSNLRLIDWAVNAQLDQVIGPGCRVWRSSGRFDHSKLMVVDGAWALVGSSNLDARSLRLNFELDIEIMDRVVATEIDRVVEARMKGARRETLQDLKARPFPIRLRNRALWLFSPYL